MKAQKAARYGTAAPVVPAEAPAEAPVVESGEVKAKPAAKKAAPKKKAPAKKAAEEEEIMAGKDKYGRIQAAQANPYEQDVSGAN